MYAYTIIFDLQILLASFITLSQIDFDLKILFKLILDLNAHILASTSLTIDFSRL
jgi:hypothetical protein